MIKPETQIKIGKFTAIALFILSSLGLTLNYFIPNYVNSESPTTLPIPMPNDADGDVMRRLEEAGFDFSVTHKIDFIVDFDNWPPDQNVIKTLAKKFGEISIVEPDDEFDGCLEFQTEEILTYDLVTSIQRQATLIAEPFNGRCESWGVMQE